MNKKIGITIITDIDDLIMKVNNFIANISGNDALELPHVLNALIEWELKNIELLTYWERNSYKLLKTRIENLMSEFKVTFYEQHKKND